MRFEMFEQDGGDEACLEAGARFMTLSWAL
jgi:hypothetical protein